VLCEVPALAWQSPLHLLHALTTNLAFADWHTVFPSATCATALVERVVHHADIVKIDGESYRLRESQADATSRRKSRREKKQTAEG
jgi:IstB-like ATP binding protein